MNLSMNIDLSKCSVEELCHLASSMKCSDALYELAKLEIKEVLNAVAFNPNTTPEILNFIFSVDGYMDNCDKEILLSKRKDMPSEVIDRMAKSKSCTYELLGIIAEHPNTWLSTAMDILISVTEKLAKKRFEKQLMVTEFIPLKRSELYWDYVPLDNEIEIFNIIKSRGANYLVG